MHTVTIDIRSPTSDPMNLAVAWKTQEADGVRISFKCFGSLWKTFSVKRWQLIKVLMSAGPVTIREAARRVQRDVKAVHGDIHTLLNAGLLEKTTDGKILFPYDAIHIDFMLKAA